jgi:hypothetical protein
MAVSPLLLQAGWFGRFASVGTGFFGSVKQWSRLPPEVLLCIHGLIGVAERAQPPTKWAGPAVVPLSKAIFGLAIYVEN